MARTDLTDARVRALKPRKTAYDIRDGKLRGFGLRVLPSGGKRFFVHCQHRGERVWKIIGDAASIDVREARSRAVTMLAAIYLGEKPPRDPAETFFEAVAEATFERRSRVWKPGTLAVNRAYLRSQILPHFTGRQVADIDSRDVTNWFASLRATPVAADRSMPVLSVIMREAEAMGLRPEGSNPCKATPPRPRSLVPGPEESRHRGCAPPRPPPHRGQPRGDERRAGAGGLAAARTLQCPHDPALRSSWGPRNRGSRREGRPSHRQENEQPGRNLTEPSSAGSAREHAARRDANSHHH